MSDQLRDKLNKQLDTGKGISSKDVASFSKPEQDGKVIEQSMTESTKTERQKTQDKLVNSAEGAAKPVETNIENIEITPEDKSAFTDAIINNERMVLRFKRLADKVRVTVRSRTVRETDAILKQLQKESRQGRFENQMAQLLRLRSFLMVFQLAEYNGHEYASPEEPLVTISTDEGVEQPSWVERADEFYAYGDAIHTILWSCVQEFEDKYWMMTDSANEVNFW